MPGWAQARDGFWKGNHFCVGYVFGRRVRLGPDDDDEGRWQDRGGCWGIGAEQYGSSQWSRAMCPGVHFTVSHTRS